MPGARIEIRAEGGGEMAAALRDAAARARDPRGMYEHIGMSLVVSTQRRFERQQAPDGNPWPPSIRAREEGGRTLIDSARLFQSISYEAAADGALIGTNVIYAAVHQFGAVIRPLAADKLHFILRGEHKAVDEVEIPARAYLGLDADDEREIVSIAEDWLNVESSDAR